METKPVKLLLTKEQLDNLLRCLCFTNSIKKHEAQELISKISIATEKLFSY